MMSARCRESEGSDGGTGASTDWDVLDARRRLSPLSALSLWPLLLLLRLSNQRPPLDESIPLELPCRARLSAVRLPSECWRAKGSRCCCWSEPPPAAAEVAPLLLLLFRMASAGAEGLRKRGSRGEA